MTPRVRLLAVAPAPVASDGVWALYTGGVVQTLIWGVSDGVIDLVVDLSTLTIAADVLPALADHYLPVGRWSDLAVSDAGIVGRLHLFDAPAEGAPACEHPYFTEAAALREALAQGLPWQASIGAEPDPARGGAFERLTAPALVNGRLVTPGEAPCYVLRNSLLTEASVVLFGADRHTKRLAAARHASPPEVPMITPAARLAALAAILGDAHQPAIALAITEGLDDAAVTDRVRLAQVTDLRAQLAAVTAARDALTAERDAAKAEAEQAKAALAALTPPVVPAPNTASAPSSPFAMSSTELAKASSTAFAAGLARARQA
jgi:hypothetical protein